MGKLFQGTKETNFLVGKWGRIKDIPSSFNTAAIKEKVLFEIANIPWLLRVAGLENLIRN